MKSPSHECSMTFLPLTNSDFSTNQTFHQFYDLDTELDHHQIMSGFHGAFAKGVACKQGTLTLQDTWFRPPFWNLIVLKLLRPDSSNLSLLSMSLLDFEYPLNTPFYFLGFTFKHSSSTISETDRSKAKFRRLAVRNRPETYIFILIFFICYPFRKARCQCFQGLT